MSQFIIYRASAGSGKTFMLVRKYLERVFLAPGDYRKILAVTFTNKAADEMKGRILSELDLLHRSPLKSKHLDHLKAQLDQQTEWIQHSAGRIKSQMLHEYSRVSVGTIDSFFQQVLRSFARESGLLGDYELQLDPDVALEEFARYVFREANTHSSVMDWLVDWTSDRLENNKTWYKLEADLVNLGRELLKESVLTLITGDESAMPTTESISLLRKKCRSVSHDFTSKCEDISTQALSVLEAGGLAVTEFAFGLQGPAGTLLKLGETKKEPGKRALGSLDEPDKWVARSSKNRSILIQTAYPELNSLMHKTIDLFDKEYRYYITAQAIQRNLFALGFSSMLFEFLRDYSHSNNQLLMSLVQPLVFQIVRDNPSPFLYEKTGTWLKHFLIDEFQDTSDLQWRNFKPLVEDSLSTDGLSMVVGDVKQSLYRWRNSNWRLLHDRAASDLKSFGTESLPLATNQRSRSSVIDFNNRIFSKLPGAMADTIGLDEATIIKDVFHSSEQEKGIKAGLEGRVGVRFYQTKDDREEWLDKLAADIVATVDDLLLNKGYSQSDITFLVRSNREADKVSTILAGSGRDWTLISSDVFKIANSPVVTLVIYALKYLSDPGMTFYRDLFLWETGVRATPGQYPVPGHNQEEMQNFENFISENNSSDLLSFTDSLIKNYSLDTCPSDLPYLYQFRDQIKGCMKRGIGHSAGFLDWWDMKGSGQMLASDSTGEAMRIMTIHKAKGLSSPVIILPFCNWNFNHTGLNAPWLWVTTENTPFNQVKQIPVRYESTLAQSCFSADYNLERIDACLDSLTVLYVAFTRAEDALFAFCPVGTKVNTVADALYAELKDDLTGDLVFLAGDMSFRNSSAVVTASQESALPVPMIAGKMKDEVRHRSQADSETTRFGRIVHQVLENVTCPADLGPSLNRMVSSGMVSQAESEFVHIFISRLFNNPVVNEWFSGDWEVLTEAAILVPGGAERRPDRVLIRGDQSVVIDYKTGTRKPVHQQQVSEYMDLLKSMGYSNVRGFLLYLYEGAVAEVKERAGSFQPGLWDQEA